MVGLLWAIAFYFAVISGGIIAEKIMLVMGKVELAERIDHGTHLFAVGFVAVGFLICIVIAIYTLATFAHASGF